jgi:hypothetical protein
MSTISPLKIITRRFPKNRSRDNHKKDVAPAVETANGREAAKAERGLSALNKPCLLHLLSRVKS